jgi:threonine synthase
MGWFDLSTLKEPYRLEGKKTMGLELAEQLGWRLPDVILYPTGGGTGLIGMWKAFDELMELGWIGERRTITETCPECHSPMRLLKANVGSGQHFLGCSRYPACRGTKPVPSGLFDTAPTRPFPRLYACQAEGCAPIVRAFEGNQRFAEPFPNAHTVASGLRVPAAVADFMILDAIRASGAKAVAGREDSIGRWMRRAGATEGISLCPETAVCLDVLAQLVAAGEVGPDEEVVVFNTGAATKYLEAVPVSLPTVDKDAVDWGAIERR